MKKIILIIESICLSVKNNKNFIIYQIINILLIYKKKQQIN
jgi:hypothetical protein